MKVKCIKPHEGFTMGKIIKIDGVEVSLTREQLEKAIEEFDKPEFNYPICCKCRTTGIIVLFTDLTSGTVLKESSTHTFRDVGYTSHDWAIHTIKEYWEEIPYDKERGFYHLQPAYAWDSSFTHAVVFGFYDALNKNLRYLNGDINRNLTNDVYDNYSAEIPEHMKEFKEIE